MRKLLLLFLCTIVPAVVSAQRLDVTGRVLVKDTGKPIGQAVVELPQSGLWAVADADGNFTVKGVPAGETRFVVSCLGFVTTEAEVDVRTGMGPVRLYAPEDNLKLESVVVTAKEAPNAMATSRTIGGNAIDHLQMVNASDISALLPTMSFRCAAAGARPAMRRSVRPSRSTAYAFPPMLRWATRRVPAHATCRRPTSSRSRW